jgi:hypothetical protein
MVEFCVLILMVSLQKHFWYSSCEFSHELVNFRTYMRKFSKQAKFRTCGSTRWELGLLHPFKCIAWCHSEVLEDFKSIPWQNTEYGVDFEVPIFTFISHWNLPVGPCYGTLFFPNKNSQTTKFSQNNNSCKVCVFMKFCGDKTAARS